MIRKLIWIVSISSIIGWLTNYVAIKMLFKPRKAIDFKLFKLQGLIPKRKKELGESIAEIVQSEVISIKDIIESLDRSKIDNEIEKMIDNFLDNNLEDEIKAKFPKLSLFFTKSLIEKIKSAIKESILSNKEKFIEDFIIYIEENIDFKQIIKDNVDSFSLEKLEEVVFSLSKKELKHIEFIGAVLGGIIGVVQFFIIHFF